MVHQMSKGVAIRRPSDLHSRRPLVWRNEPIGPMSYSLIGRVVPMRLSPSDVLPQGRTHLAAFPRAAESRALIGPLTYEALVDACSMPERYGRLARSLFYHSAGRTPTVREAEHLESLLGSVQSFQEAQDHLVRPSLGRLSRTDPEVMLDGVQEPVWTLRSSPQVANNLLFGSVDDDNDLSATWWGMWNDEYLYVFVSVLDAQRQNSESPVYQDDSVEVYIDGHREGGNSYDLNDFQYLFRPGDNVAHVGGGRQGMSNDGVLHGSEPAPGGYNIEVAIPWTTLGVSPGGHIGMEIHVNDDDDGGFRDAQVSWRTTAGNAWTVPSVFTPVDLATPVLFAAEGVTVDGMPTDATWNLPIGEPITRQAWPIPLSNNAALWQARWDADKLYFFVRVADSNVLAPDGPEPYHDDSIEISIDANNGHDGAIDLYDDFQFIFRAGESGVVHAGDVSSPTDLSSIQSDSVGQQSCSGQLTGACGSPSLTKSKTMVRSGCANCHARPNPQVPRTPQARAQTRQA
jgi:hypothetical protein